MIRHVVLFCLKSDQQKEEAITQFKEAIEALPTHIGIIRNISVQRNMNPDEDYDIILTADFDTLEDLRTYATHPQHLAAAKILADLKDGRACVDYEI